MMVEALQPQRDPSRNPIFQVAFQFQNVDTGVLDLPGLTLEEVESDFSAARLDLMLSMNEGPDGVIQGAFQFNSDLYDEGFIQQMAEHFQRLLSGMIQEPDLPVSNVSLLEPSERQRLISQWNETAIEFPRDTGIHKLVENQVEETPHVVAIEDFGGELSYEELNSRANRIAHYLVEKGVGPGFVVGLCLDRSVEMLVGCWAFLKLVGLSFLWIQPTPHCGWKPCWRTRVQESWLPRIPSWIMSQGLMG
jgi:non-ribosomal peptide synthetase component F